MKLFRLAEFTLTPPPESGAHGQFEPVGSRILLRPGRARSGGGKQNAFRLVATCERA